MLANLCIYACKILKFYKQILHRKIASNFSRRQIFTLLNRSEICQTVNLHNNVRKGLTAMKLIEFLLIIMAFFIGTALLIHMCSKHKYVFRYYSDKRKIEICPSDKSHQTTR